MVIFGVKDFEGLAERSSPETERKNRKGKETSGFGLDDKDLLASRLEILMFRDKPPK
jgi:hypothetical protein